MKKLWIAVLATLLTSVAALAITPAEQAAVARAEEAGMKNWLAQDVADYLPLKRQQDADVPLGERIAQTAMLQKETSFKLGSGLYDYRTADCLTLILRSVGQAVAQDWNEFYVSTQALRCPVTNLGPIKHSPFVEDILDSGLLEKVTLDLSVPVASYQANLRYAAELRGLKIGQYNAETGENDNELGRQKAEAIANALENCPPDKKVTIDYVPKEHVAEAASKIKSGDIVTLISWRQNPKRASWGKWLEIPHVGIAVKEKDTFSIIHADHRGVIKETASDYFTFYHHRSVGFGVYRPVSDLRSKAQTLATKNNLATKAPSVLDANRR